jgi:hypothetical protein
MNHLTLTQCKAVWIAGAVQRLFTLGYFRGNLPFWVKSEGVDDFLKIDEHRDFLFPDDSEIRSIFCYLLSKTDQVLDENDIDLITNVLISYRDDRDNLVKYALCHSYT